MAGVAGRYDADGKVGWADRARLGAWFLAVAGLAFVFGMFVFGPMRTRAQEFYLPPGIGSMSTGIVELQNGDVGMLLPVRIADTSQTRSTGFTGVGAKALDNSFLLYALPRQTSVRTSYSVKGVQSPLEFAVIDAEGKVVAIASSTPGTERLSVTQPHRWLLAAKAGTFGHYGIAVGTTLDPESVRKINL